MHFKKICFIFNCAGGGCACECICLQRPEEGIRSLGAVAKGGCKLPDMRLGTKLRSAGRAANALHPEPPQPLEMGL